MTIGKIRAAIFDYGGVLMRTVNPTPRHELGQRLGLPSGGVDELVFESPLWDAAQLGRVSSVEFWTHAARRLGLGAEEMAEFRQTFWAGDRLDEDLLALVDHLRGSGYRTALLSNAPADLRQLVERSGVADVFDVVVVSGCEGVVKPDPEIFERTLARLGVSAQEAIFVDDDRVNVAAARSVGLEAVRFLGLPPLRKRMQDLGLPIPDPAVDPLPDVRAIIFDWGGVMESLPDEGIVVEWERRLALGPGTLPEVLWGGAWRQYSIGALTGEGYLRHIADGLGFPDVGTADHLLEALNADNRVYSEVAAAARALRGRYKVALLTNAFPGQDALIRERFGLDVHSAFDVYVNSAYVGLRKPAPAIFHFMLERLSVAPQQAVFLDDRLRNVDSARELGIHAVQFVDPSTSLAELESLLGHAIGRGDDSGG
jgi:HAD superfamily hydrolase (TIGR01509 family)